MLKPVVTVSVELAPALTELGLKFAVAPDGRPDAERFTVWVLPEVIAVLMVLVAEFP